MVVTSCTEARGEAGKQGDIGDAGEAGVAPCGLCAARLPPGGRGFELALDPDVGRLLNEFRKRAPMFCMALGFGSAGDVRRGAIGVSGAWPALALALAAAPSGMLETR